MKRDTKSFPGVSTSVDPALWLSRLCRFVAVTTVAATADVCGGSWCEALRWRRREVIMSASGGREWCWELLPPLVRVLSRVRSVRACVAWGVGSVVRPVCDNPPRLFSMFFSASLCCASSTTELERVFDRVVVGDCDALSSVQPSSPPSASPSSSSSSSPTSKWTAAWGSGEDGRDLFGFASDRFGGAISLLEAFNACLAWP